jgi:hypothetical protein
MVLRISETGSCVPKWDAVLFDSALVHLSVVGHKLTEDDMKGQYEDVEEEIDLYRIDIYVSKSFLKSYVPVILLQCYPGFQWQIFSFRGTYRSNLC